MHDVFISFSFKDKAIADAVICALESRHIKCWISYRDAEAGEDYAASIIRAIRSSVLVLLVFSENSNCSRHVLNEINSAVNAEKPIIPFKVSDFELSDSLEYYLGKTHWLDAITPPLQKHLDELCTSITETLDKKHAEAAPVAVPARHRSECRMATYDELLDLGYTSASIAIQLVENDYIIYNGIDEENEGTAEQWEVLLQDFSDCCGYMLNSDHQIVGDWNMIALSDEKFEVAMQGELLESELVYEDVEFVGFPGDYNGYILAMGLLPNYRNSKNHMMMLNNWLEHITELSENGVFFKRLMINAFNKEGEALVKGMGFRYLCDNRKFGKLYILDFLPLPSNSFFRRNKRLVENYEKHYYETL